MDCEGWYHADWSGWIRHSKLTVRYPMPKQQQQQPVEPVCIENRNRLVSPGSFFLFACLAATQASAACSRDDVDYYLSKGFSREQVTAICEGSGGSGRQENTYQPYRNPQEEYARQEEQRRGKEEERTFMQKALKVWDVELTREKLEYTRRFCLSAGKAAEVNARTKVCPDVRYSVFFKGLKVGDYGRKYFFLGSREIQVSGTVERNMLHDLSEYPSEIRRELLASYEHASRQGGTAIPVLRDAPINRVIDILRKYAY